jgi:hypothetical protein
MKALSKGLMTIALVAATAACDGSPTAGSALVAGEGISAAQAPSGSLTFASTQSSTEQAPQTASGGAGSISFTGSITTPTPCYDVSATQSTRRGTITLTVTASPNGGFCAQVLTNNNYTGSISGLAAGTYTFNVVHVTDGRSQTAYTSTVTVQ